jgi:hypothetical protein
LTYDLQYAAEIALCHQHRQLAAHQSAISGQRRERGATAGRGARKRHKDTDNFLSR